MPIDARLVMAGAEANEVFGRLVAKMEIDDLESARAAGMLVASIAEMMSAVLLLMGSPVQSHAPVLLRSMIEALVDLKCLVADERYLEQLEFNDLHQLVRVFRDFADDPRFMADENRAQQIAGMRARIEPRYEELRPGKAPIDAATRFRRAGMAGDYVAYRTYCTWSHNQLFALQGRHRPRGTIEMGAAMPQDTQRSVLTNAVSFYARALEVVPNFATNIEADEVREAINIVDALITNVLPPGWGVQ